MAGAVGWVAVAAPRIDLGLRLRDYVAQHPGLRALSLRAAVSFCWGETSRACYEKYDPARRRCPRATSMSASLGVRVPGGARIPALPQVERLRLAG